MRDTGGLNKKIYIINITKLCAYVIGLQAVQFLECHYDTVTVCKDCTDLWDQVSWQLSTTRSQMKQLKVLVIR